MFREKNMRITGQQELTSASVLNTQKGKRQEASVRMKKKKTIRVPKQSIIIRLLQKTVGNSPERLKIGSPHGPAILLLAIKTKKV